MSFTTSEDSAHLLFDPTSAPDQLLLNASAASATSLSTVQFNSTTGALSAIIYASPGSPIPTSYQTIACATCGDSDDLAQLVFTPAPDLYNGQSYSIELLVGADGYSAKTSVGAPSPVLLAAWGWPWWPFGGGTPPTPPPAGPAVPPPVVPGPIALPPLPPGAALPPGLPTTLGQTVAQQGILLARLGSNTAKCALINNQIRILGALPCKTPAQKTMLEGWLYWAYVLSC